MSSLTRVLFALAVLALLQGAHSSADRCARFLVGRRSDHLVKSGATPMPVHVTQRHGWVPIPPYGFRGVRVEGINVILCNMDTTRVAPTATPHGKVNSDNLRIYVHLEDGKKGPANMELYIEYYVEPLRSGLDKTFKYKNSW